MKRERSENSVDNSTDAKHSKCDNDDPLTPFMKDFNEIQDGIEKLDMKCAFEQMNIQKQFDEQKRPLFERRGKIIEQIPGFWATTLKKHPALCDIIPDDIEILKHIVRLDLKDNMDNNGSYKITFEFSEGASEYFEPLTLVKHVTFDNKQERIVECTKIKWKDGKDPIATVKKQRSRYGNELPAWSVFEWFTSEDCPDLPDVGEIIRREIWHNPITFYLGIEETGDDYEDEDGEDDDDDEDDDDEEEEEEEDEDEEDEEEEDEEEEEEEDKSETKK